MKCSQCGTEFEGKFCPECGAKSDVETPITPPPEQRQTQQFYQNPAPAASAKPAKKKKPFFLRWWFILLIIIAIALIVSSIRKGGERIVWSDVILGDMLPEPPAKKGELHSNSADRLDVTFNKVSDMQYTEYVDKCKGSGFTVEAESSSSSYEAYNTDGYKLNLYHYSSNKELSIELEAPMEMGSITWPNGTAGSLLPIPKSTKGAFSHERDDSFAVYIGDTPKFDYDEYVTACSERGFNVNYSKDENYYRADNSDGWHISLSYEGNNVMRIDIDAPSELDDGNGISTPSAEDPQSNMTTPEPEVNNIDGLRPDFKEAMDSYEAFMDEYVAFMKKYAESDGTDMGLLADYTSYMSKYADVVEKFGNWESEGLNAAETAYYIDVQARVSKKLLEVAN